MPKREHASLIEVQDHFVRTWGQMGSAWGISRTMAEVHALLFVTGEALCTDEVMARLEISRGNASMSLRALVDWGVVARVHRRGDRKEYFAAEQDVWTMIRAILRERLKREVEPILASLYEIRDMTPAKSNAKPITEHNERLDELLLFLQTLEQFAQRFVSPMGEALQAAAVLLSEAGESRP